MKKLKKLFVSPIRTNIKKESKCNKTVVKHAYVYIYEYIKLTHSDTCACVNVNTIDYI